MVFSVYITGQRTSPTPAHQPDVSHSFSCRHMNTTQRTQLLLAHKMFVTPANNVLNQTERLVYIQLIILNYLPSYRKHEDSHWWYILCDLFLLEGIGYLILKQINFLKYILLQIL